jgi:hypothetical protein
MVRGLRTLTAHDEGLGSERWRKGQGFELGVQGLVFRVQGSGIRVQGSVFRFENLAYISYDSEVQVEDSGSRVAGLYFEV